MAEIYNFKIFKADAFRKDDGITVRLWYPDNKQMVQRMPENLEYGIKVFESLIPNGYSEIADSDNPIRPASAGSLVMTKDGKIIVNRRDKDAPTHKLYHTAYVGFGQDYNSVYTSKGLRETGLKESAEECLLITRDKDPYLIVPNDSERYVLESAKRIGLGHLNLRNINVEAYEPRDKIQIFDVGNNLIFELKTNLNIFYESSVGLNCLEIRRLEISSDEIYPVDAEGILKNDQYRRFNRESYILNPSDLGKFGSILDDPEVYQADIADGKLQMTKPVYESPFFGPDMVKVNNPHIWAPDDTLSRCLDALDVPGYNWIKVELWKEMSKSNGRHLIPDDVIV